MRPFTLDWAADAIGAALPAPDGRLVTSVSSDTRSLAPGSLFFALVGERTDGHQFIEQAFSSGAVAAVVSERPSGCAGTLLLCRVTTEAFGDLASAYRRQFNVPVAAVTGSVGKTTTREMIAAALQDSLNTLTSAKNFNNEIGVPQTLFNLEASHAAVVLEMGMRGSGQIARLAEIARPNIGVITRIGFSHIELLGSQDAVAAAKAELLEALPNGGTAILPVEDGYFEFLRERVPAGVTVFGYGGGQARDARLRVAGNDPAELTVQFDGQEVALSLVAPGSHLAHNAAAALATAVTMGVPLESAVKGLARWTGAEGRMAVSRTGSVTLLDDCYNAGPESMEAALVTLSQTPAARHVAVLGDMKELGEWAHDLHARVGQTAGQYADLLVTVGELAAEIGRTASRAHTRVVELTSTAEAAAQVPLLLEPGDAVLVKGSRAMGLEAVTAAIRGAMDGRSDAC